MKIVIWLPKRFDEFTYKDSVAWQRHVELMKHFDSLHFNVETRIGQPVHVRLTSVGGFDCETY